MKYRVLNRAGSRIDPSVLAASLLFLGPAFALGCMDAPTESFSTVEVAGDDDILFKTPAPLPCAGRSIDDPCTTETGEEGLCIDGGDAILICTVVEPCYDSVEGESCTTQWQSPGVCMDYFAGNLHCEPQGTCVTGTEGAPCETEFKETGSCTSAGRGGLLYCRLKDPCDGKSEREPCTTVTVTQGQCVDISHPDADLTVGRPSTNLYCREIE